MDIGAWTDKGQIRENNEDSFFAEKDGCVFVVADGVGGQNAGEVASGIAAGEIGRYVKENLVKFINGSRPLSEYDDYLKQCYDMGAEKLIEIKQQALDRYMSN